MQRGTERDRSLDIYCQEVQRGLGVWIPTARRYREGLESGYLLLGGTGRDRSLDTYCQEVQREIVVWIPIARRYREG